MASSSQGPGITKNEEHFMRVFIVSVVVYAILICNLSICYAEDNSYSENIEIYSQKIKDNPEDKESIYNLALLYKRMEKYNLAIQSYENLIALVEAVIKAKPSGAKGQYIKSATISSTMGPGIKLELKSLMALSSSTL